MSTDELLFEVQCCDELLYTSAEANLMLEYQESVKSFSPRNKEEEDICKNLSEKFGKLNRLITEFESRIELTANNVVEPTKNEIEELKKMFDEIETLDFETSEAYESLIGNLY